MNVHDISNNLPHNVVHSYLAPFNWFAAVLILIFTVACVMVSLIRYWRWLARRKFATMRARELPSMWDGYWGWR